MRHFIENKPLCPSCNERLDGASNAEEDEDIEPKPRDITVCIYCGSLLIFNQDMSLRVGTIEQDVPEEQQEYVRQIVATIQICNTRYKAATRLCMTKYKADTAAGKN